MRQHTFWSHPCVPALFCIALATLLGACSRPQLLELSGATMGTRFHVSLGESVPAIDPDRLAAEIAAILDDVDRLASTYRPDSALATFNASNSTDWQTAPAALCNMIEFASELHDRSGGAYDISIAPLVDLWGFGAGEASPRVPAARDIEALRPQLGMHLVETDCDNARLRKDHARLALDLSSLAKGHAVDRIAAHLDASGIDNYLVEVGGELRVRGHKRDKVSFVVLIEDPVVPGEGLRIPLADIAVATSGTYRNQVEYDGREYSHAIDPRTGRPVRHTLRSVTVLDASCERADALATALLILGPDEGQRFAEENRIAAMFQIFDDDEIVRVTTSEFDALVDRQ